MRLEPWGALELLRGTKKATPARAPAKQSFSDAFRHLEATFDADSSSVDEAPWSSIDSSAQQHC